MNNLPEIIFIEFSNLTSEYHFSWSKNAGEKSVDKYSWTEVMDNIVNVCIMVSDDKMYN